MKLTSWVRVQRFEFAVDREPDEALRILAASTEPVLRGLFAVLRYRMPFVGWVKGRRFSVRITLWMAASGRPRFDGRVVPTTTGSLLKGRLFVNLLPAAPVVAMSAFLAVVASELLGFLAVFLLFGVGIYMWSFFTERRRLVRTLHDIYKGPHDGNRADRT